MLVLTLVIVHVYDWYNPIWAKIDKLMSYRLGLAQNAYNNYGIHVFGQAIKWVGYDYKSILVGSNEPYNYVDSSYLPRLPPEPPLPAEPPFAFIVTEPVTIKVPAGAAADPAEPDLPSLPYVLELS